LYSSNFLHITAKEKQLTWLPFQLKHVSMYVLKLVGVSMKTFHSPVLRKLSPNHKIIVQMHDAPLHHASVNNKAVITKDKN
jgi:hypothetical protein